MKINVLIPIIAALLLLSSSCNNEVKQIPPASKTCSTGEYSKLAGIYTGDFGGFGVLKLVMDI